METIPTRDRKLRPSLFVRSSSKFDSRSRSRCSALSSLSPPLPPPCCHSPRQTDSSCQKSRELPHSPASCSRTCRHRACHRPDSVAGWPVLALCCSLFDSRRWQIARSPCSGVSLADRRAMVTLQLPSSRWDRPAQCCHSSERIERRSSRSGVARSTAGGPRSFAERLARSTAADFYRHLSADLPVAAATDQQAAVPRSPRPRTSLATAAGSPRSDPAK